MSLEKRSHVRNSFPVLFYCRTPAPTACEHGEQADLDFFGETPRLENRRQQGHSEREDAFESVKTDHILVQMPKFAQRQ